MKKLREVVAVALLMAILVVFMPRVGIASDLKIAELNTSEVLVDGVTKKFEAYTIESNNYFKLRDIAMVLNGTYVQFEVAWNNETKAIDIITNKPYTSIGGEMEVTSQLSNKEARRTISKIYCNGKEEKLTVYTIEGNNYFKLRDLETLVGFRVTWDDNTKKIGILTSAEEQIGIEDSFYYINETLDEEFHNNPEAYAIFKYDNGKTQQISANKAYEFCQIGNSIYYMKMNYLAREDGSAQVGPLWKLDLGSGDETQVIEDNIYTVTSDDRYIYFTKYDDLRNDIMRMEPGKKPEVFIEDCKTYRLVYNDEWLYYVENNNYNIMKINVKTKEQKKVSANRADPESGLKFFLHKNTLLMPTYDEDWNSIMVKEDITTSKKTVLPSDDISYLGVSKNGTLFYLDRDKEQIIFTNLNN